MSGQITTLRVQKRNRDRVNVYLDGEYRFSLVSHLAVPLRRGQILSEHEIAHLKEEDAYHHAYEQMARFIAFRPRSEVELRQRMARHNISAATADRVMERLATVGLLDDAQFARQWVENRITFRPRSRRMLRYELTQKGLAEPVIEQAIEQVDEAQDARRLAMEKGQKLSHLEWSAFRQKLTGYLTRRGYPYDLTRRVIQEAWQALGKGADNVRESEEEEWTSSL
ncbi:MAG: regulatory protein RecX [Chloroflexota bacterium]